MALWRGWVPSVIGVVPYVGLNFAVYETLKEVVLDHYGEDRLPVIPPTPPPPLHLSTPPPPRQGDLFHLPFTYCLVSHFMACNH